MTWYLHALGSFPLRPSDRYQLMGDTKFGIEANQETIANAGPQEVVSYL